MSRLPALVPPAVAGTAAVSLDGTTPGVPVYVEVDFQVPILQPLTVPVTPTAYAGTWSLGLRLPAGGRVRVASVGGPPVLGAGVRGPWHSLYDPARLRPPTLPPVLDPRSGAVGVLGAFPGALVEIGQPSVGGIGRGVADARGRASVVLTAAILANDDLQVRQELDGAWSAWATPAVERLVVPFGPLSVPGVYAGQAAVRVVGTVAGSRIDVGASPSGVSGSGWATGEWPGTTDVTLSGPLQAGDVLTVDQVYVGVGGGAGPGLSVAVPGAEGVPAPTVVGPVYAGATAVRVAGVVPGMLVTVVATVPVAPAEGPVAEEDPVVPVEPVEVRSGPAPVGFDGWLEVPVAAGSGMVVRLDWTLGTVGSGLVLAGATAEVPVVEVPTELRGLTVMPALFDCGLAALVLSVPGAGIAVTEDGGLVGFARVSSALGEVGVPTVPLVTGRALQAVETLPGAAERVSAIALVRAEAAPVQPRPLAPIGPGDPFVWVSAVNPGAAVWVTSGGAPLGWTVASDPVVQVATLPVPNRAVVARSRLCDQGPLSARVRPQPDPGTPGPYAPVVVDVTLGDTPSGVPLHGRLYFPVDPRNGLVDPQWTLRLFVFGHGDPPGPESAPLTALSYQGYDVVGIHLATHGWVMFSIDGGDANIVEAWFVDALVRLTSGVAFPGLDPSLHLVLAGAPVVVGGQSDGGDPAAAVANGPPAGVTVVGLVLVAVEDTASVAPSIRRTPQKVPPFTFGVPLLVVTGTLDYGLFGIGTFQGGIRPQVCAVLEHAAHNSFNAEWAAAAGANEEILEAKESILGAADPALVQAVLRDLVTVFLLGLVDGGDARQWLASANRPRSFRGEGLLVHVQYLSVVGPDPRSVPGGGPLIVDNFGDLDPVLLPNGNPVALTNYPDTNTLGQPVRVADGAAMTLLTSAESNPSMLGLSIAFAGGSWRCSLAPAPPVPTPVRGLVQHTDFLTARWGPGWLLPANTNPPPYPALDVVLSLSDLGGRIASVRLGAVAPAVWVGAVYPGDARFLAAWYHARIVRSVGLPVDAFVAACPDLDWASVMDLTLDNPSTEEVPLWLDDVEFVS